MAKSRRIQLAITLGTLLVALAHVLVPDIKIDAITVSLIVIAVLPWLGPLFKSIELPGGVKVEFQQLEQAMEKADAVGLISEVGTPQARDKYAFQLVQVADPNLALAGLRIELEQRLRSLALAHEIESKRYGITWLLSTLRLKKVLTAAQERVLEDLSHLLNAAVHGAEVDPRAGAWAAEVGPQLLESLDELIAQAHGPGPTG